MKSLSLLSLSVALAATGFVYSCASTDTGDFSASTGGTGANGGSGNPELGGGGKSNLGTGANATGSTVGAGGAPTASTECGASNVEAQLTPIFMVFIYDSSASMGINNSYTPPLDQTEQRWKPVKLGLQDFFNSADAANVQASISFFPYPGDKAATCTHDYAVPDVAMTSLDAPAKLIAALDAKVPEGGTPTLPAVMGGIKLAKKLLTDNPGSQAMVVLVTDGEPAIYNNGVVETDCAPAGVTLTNTIADIAVVVNNAKLGSPSIATHVIGIGTALTSLGQIATAGGTELLLIDPSEPALTTAAIVTKLDAIQTKQISCNIPIPSNSKGYDPEKVNVNFTHSNGITVDPLIRSNDCSTAGWHYDDATNPKYIELCPATCETVQKDVDGKISIQLGCPTRVIT